ncbi:hypothetical protein [Aeromicrobium sp. 9AM]|uniref:hypothetical protein n=1 Tax=Aeromicrobium sp. 9AM TaxID=2653126 RepID=UPI0012EF0127|nr:hypothetical protein [Aeromicrobium sp. 9AM]VXC54909.1 conserved hypothetical protein [Aeromicrobium sp. 9AM]
MAVYGCYGLTIESDLDLPELGASIADPPPYADVVIAEGVVGPPAAGAAELPWGLWRLGDVCGGDIPDVVRFEVRHGRRITIQRHAGADDRDVRLYVLGTMLGSLMMQRGHLVLHGNAIRVGDSAAVVVGRSGAGKSTLAAEFARRGFDLLSDDVVPIDQDGRALPGYPQIKLWDDALVRLGLDFADYERVAGARAKFHVPVERGSLAALPLRWVYGLDVHDGAEVGLLPLHGVDAFDLLRANTYRRELIADREASWQHLQQCAAVAGRAAVVRVLRPSAAMSAEATADAILTDIAERSTSDRPTERVRS